MEEIKKETNDAINSNPFIFHKNPRYEYENPGFYPGYFITFNPHFLTYSSKISIKDRIYSSHILTSNLFHFTLHISYVLLQYALILK